MSQEQLSNLAQENLVTSFTQYQNDPTSFLRDILREFVWDKLEEALNAVRDHPRVAITGANAVGKGWLAGRIALWWLNCFTPAKVITTAAPPARQIRELLWAEMRSAQKTAIKRGIPLCGGQPQTMAIRTDNPNHWAQGFVIPMSGTSEERVSKFQGHHSPHLLFLFDEAYGIPEEIYDAADSCLSGGHNHFVLLSNPLLTAGPFYRRVRSGEWHTIHIEAFDHPNVISGKELVPGAVTREKTYSRIIEGSRVPREDEDLSKLPEEALFTVPEYFEREDLANPQNEPIAGTLRIVTTPALSTKVLGRFPLQGSNALINLAWINRANQNWLEYHEENWKPPEVDGNIIAGFDVAEFGEDENVLLTRHDWYVTRPKVWNGVDPIVAGDIAIGYLSDPTLRVHVDGTGVGAGTGPYMKKKGYRKAYTIKMGQGATVSVKQVTKVDPELLPATEFDRMRSQAYWLLREWLRTTEHAAIPPDEELEAELMALTYDKLPNDRLQVLPKKKVKELLHRSPNKSDALALTFAQGGPRWGRPKFLSLSSKS